jgi:hypothetical protein
MALLTVGEFQFYRGGTMALIEINWKPARRELQQFGGIWLPAFLLLMGWLAFARWDSVTIAAILWSVTAVIVPLGWLVPELFRHLFVGWMCAAWPIGWLVSHLILSVTYYLVLTPIGLILRWCGHDPLTLKFDRQAETYWVPHRDRPGTDHYFRQF